MESTPESPWKQLPAYLANPDHLRNILFVLGGGYAIGLFVWEANHKDQLESYILTNEIAPGSRPSIPLLLFFTLAVFLIWLLLSVLLAITTRKGAATLLGRGSALILGASLLAFLPVLAIEGLETSQPFLVLGVIAVMGIIAGVAVQSILQDAESDSPSRVWIRHPASVGLIAIVVLSFGYTVFMSALTVARHNAFLTHSFDLGIHDQAMYTLLHHGVMHITQKGTHVINFLGDHFSPIFYLVAPIYALYQDARTLLILQSLALGIGAIPVFLLARDKTGSTLLATALGASYLLYPALHGVNTFDFHQIALVTPLLLFSLYFLETRRDLLFLTFLALALIVKEEVALTVAAIGLYALLFKRRRWLGVGIILVGLVYFALVTQIIMPALGTTLHIDRFAAIMAPGSAGFVGIGKTLITNPFYTFVFIFSNQERIIYIIQMLLPLLFLPLLAGGAWIAAVPAISVALLTSAETQYSISYQYSAITVPFIFFLAILGIQRLNPARVSRGALAAAILVSSLAMNYSYGWVFSKSFEGLPKQTAHAAIVINCLQEIPRSASVSAMSDLVPHLSNRERVYLFPVVNSADYIAFDTDTSANFWPFEGAGMAARHEAIGALISYLTSGEYGLVKYEDGCVLLNKGYDTARNTEGLKQVLSARYEAETMRSDFKPLNLPDSKASGGAARVGNPLLPHKSGKNALIYGPYDTLFPGKYLAEFALRLEDAGAGGTTPGGVVATVDVFSNVAGGALAGLDISAADFTAPDRYQTFPVMFEVHDSLPDLEYRLLYHGQGTLWVDYVRVSPTEVTLSAGS